MPPFFILFLGLSAALGCSQEPGSGARIAEDPIGPWDTLCSVEVLGPQRSARTLEGTAVHTHQSKSIATAVVNACRSAKNSSQCMLDTAQWVRKTEKCTLVKATSDKSGKRTRQRCTVTIQQPPYTPRAASQSEGKSTETACRRALVSACRSLGAGTPCTRGQKGWSHRSATARRRPRATNTP